MESDISVEISNLKLKNPLILASGILGLSGDTLNRIGESGAGALVTKSAGLSPREGYDGPTIVETPAGFLNALGLPNPGIKEMIKEIKIAKKSGLPLIASVYGFSVEEYCEASKIAEKAGADAIELNISCSHVKEVGIEIGQNPELVSEIIKKVKKKIKKPIIVKLSPNVSDIVSIAEIAEDSGADALTAINTIRAMAINVDIKRPVLRQKIGGLSGPAIKPIALRCVYEISEKVRIPLIGCGGIQNWTDVIEFILAGATAVQIGTSIIYEDISIFKKIEKGLRDYLLKNKHEAIKNIMNLGHVYD
jgi:dihydroorotate dehydrogenase (NAD+) catalytic subunit